MVLSQNKSNYFALFVSAIILGVILYFNLSQLVYFCPQPGDYALLALSVEQAKNWEILSGPYSRFGFNHPLPTYFYLYAWLEPLVWFSKYWMGKYQLITFLINSCCLLFAVGIFSRIFAKSNYSVVLITATCLIFLRTYWIGSWGPSTIPMPLLLLIISFIALIKFGQRYLLVFTTSLVLVASNHLIGSLIATVITIIGILYYLSHYSLKSKLKWQSLISLLLLLIACSPMMIDIFLNGMGSNPAKIINYILANNPENSFWEATKIAGQYFWPKRFDFAYSSYLFWGIWFLIILHMVKLSKEFRSLAFLNIIITLIAVWFARGLKEEEANSYLFSFYAASQVFMIVLLSGIISYYFRKISHTLSAKIKLSSLILKVYRVAIKLIFILILAILTKQFATRDYQPLHCELENKVKTEINKLDPTKSYQLNLKDIDSWGKAAFLVLELYKQKFSVCVFPEWELFFRRSLVCKLDQKNYQTISVLPERLYQEEKSANSFTLGRDLFILED